MMIYEINIYINDQLNPTINLISDSDKK